MDDPKKKPGSEKPQPEDKSPLCNCAQDPFAAVPPELQPRPINRVEDLRKVTCPGCGKVYWTNRNTDLCFDCEEKGSHLADVSETKNHEPEALKGGLMPARIRPLGPLKKYIGDRLEITVEPGRTVREMLSELAIPSEVVAGVVVNGTMETKDYCIQEDDEIKLYAMMSGG